MRDQRLPGHHEPGDINELMPRHVANKRRLLAALTADDRDTLTDLLRTLAAGLGDTSLG